MSSQLPPYDSSPENLQDLSEVLREGEQEMDDVLESVEMKSTALEQAIDYGEQLGFVEGGDDTLSATDQGQMYGYGSLPAEREQELFRDAIRELSVYVEFTEIAHQEIRDINDVPAISRESLTPQLRIQFEFDVTDRILDSIANTFLKTLDVAGLGEYKTGRKGYPTRIEVGEEFDEFVESLRDEEPTVSTEETEDDDGEGETDADAGGGDEGEPADEPTEDEEVTGEDVQRLMDLSSSGTSGIELNIDITISSADWDSDDVIKVVEALRDEDES